MKHFRPFEFHGWFNAMDPRLLDSLDELRERFGWKIYISPAPGAVGRHLGPHSKSRHNIDRWGKVMAVDIMPDAPRLVPEMEKLIGLAEQAGFDGIGVYPDWRPGWGLHVDVRDGEPARWGAVRRNGEQVYVTLQEALDHVDAED